LFIGTPDSVSVPIDKKDYSRNVLSSLLNISSIRRVIAEIGFVESLIETNNRSFRALCISCFRPRRSGFPPIAITPDKVEKYSEERGGQGDATPMLLPLRGREGVTLQAAAENKRITLKKRISTERGNNKKTKKKNYPISCISSATLTKRRNMLSAARNAAISCASTLSTSVFSPSSQHWVVERGFTSSESSGASAR
jgi:hypothetical protein